MIGAVPESIQTGISGGLTMTVTLVILRLFMGRLDKREAHIDGATQRLIEGMEAQVSTLSGRLSQAIERIDKVEEELRECERKHAVSNAELQVHRHDRNNLRQGMNAMFVMLKQEGADIGRVVASIEEMLARGDEVIAVEKAAIPAIRARR